MLRLIHRAAFASRWLRLAAGVSASSILVLAACGDDDAPTPNPSGTGSSGSADAGRDSRAFVDEDAEPPTDPEGRKPNDPLRVFVTNETFTGDLDGTNGADTKCKAAAEAAGLAPRGKWVAWLGTPGGQNVKDRVVDPAGTLPYHLLDGTEVAKKAGDLLTEPGLPLAAIAQSETGASITGRTWTGTQNLGEPSVTACLGWTVGEADNKGGVGAPSATDATWTELPTTDTCSTKNHLYCFEVP